MLANAMDFDPRIKFDEHGWHCNFHFGYGHDVIEDVINEKCCVQALRYLIAKADADIHDLEDELAILQCQLKWPDSDDQRDPYEVSCATFKRKINFLTKSIKNVGNRNKINEHDLDATTNIQKPAERIYDIISALIKQNFSAPDEQAEDLSNGMNLVGNSGSVDIGMEKETTSESCADSKKLMIDFEGLYKLADTISEESCSDSARYAIRYLMEARDIGKTDVEVTGKTEVDVYGCIPAGKKGDIPGLLGAKKRELQGASGENASIQSQEVSVSKDDGLCSSRNMASKSQNELVMGLEFPLAAEGIGALLDFSPANPHIVESKSTIVEDVEAEVSPPYDIEGLRLKLSQDSDFLNKMRVPELKEILKFHKVRRTSKFKKEKMIEELMKLLRAT